MWWLMQVLIHILLKRKASPAVPLARGFQQKTVGSERSQTLHNNVIIPYHRHGLESASCECYVKEIYFSVILYAFINNYTATSTGRVTP